MLENSDIPYLYIKLLQENEEENAYQITISIRLRRFILNAKMGTGGAIQAVTSSEVNGALFVQDEGELT